MRRALLKRLSAEHGGKRLAMMEPKHVAKLLERLDAHPQRNMLKALRGLVAFAIAERLMDVDPTIGCKLKRAKDTGGFKTWTDADIAQFCRGLREDEKRDGGSVFPAHASTGDPDGPLRPDR
jgi:hypothetical protein